MFKIGVFDCPPYLSYNYKLSKIRGGIEFYILQEIFKSQSVEYVIFPENSWEAARKAVSNETIDIASCAHWQYHLDLSGSVTVAPYLHSCTTFLVPKPNLLPFETFILQPFNLITWALISISILMITLMIFCSKNNSRITNFYETALQVLKLLLNTGIDGDYLHNFYRPLVALWAIASILLQTGYNAGFASIATTPRFSKPIRTYEDMLNAPLIGVSGRGNLPIAQMNRSTNSNLKNLVEHLSLDSPKNKRKDVYVVGIVQKYTATSFVKNKRFYSVLPGCIGESPMGLAIRKHSKLEKFLNERLGRYMEHGLNKAWFRFATFEDLKSLDAMRDLYSLYAVEYSGYAEIAFDRLQGAVYALF